MLAVAVFDIQIDKKPVADIIPSKSHFGSEPTNKQTLRAIF